MEQPQGFTPDRIHTPKQELDSISNSVQETMDRIYGTPFQEATENVKQDVMKKAVDDHVEQHIENSFSNPFSPEQKRNLSNARSYDLTPTLGAWE